MLRALKSSTAKIDYDKSVPSPEDVSAELRDLQARRDKLQAEIVACDEGQREIHRETADARRIDDRKLQVDSLIKGSAYEPPADARDRIAGFVRRKALLQEAVNELDHLIRIATQSASKFIVDEFRPEQQALAMEFYGHLAKAVAVHSKFGEIKQRLECAGVSSAGLHDFGSEILGVPNHRQDHAAYALRDGVRRSYIAKADVPKGYL